MNRGQFRTSLLCGVTAIAAAANPSFARAQSLSDLKNMSIDQLANVTVSSVSKSPEPLAEAPAAIYVIDHDSIVRSGAVTIPEILRLAPNLNVQQVTSSQYAIAARGFNGIQAGNKLLVLIDGRSIYTPLADSVIWEFHQPLVEDLQQVEVISGPGGTLYGPNAVNGVINLTTKSAKDTIGGLVRGTVSPEERSAAARYGFAVGSSGAMRVYATFDDREGLPAEDPRPDSDDHYRSWQIGFRSDFGGERDGFTIQGDQFHATDALYDNDHADAHNVLARWTHVLGPSSSFQFQSYYDGYSRDATKVHDSLATFDNQAQVNLVSGAHQIVAGAGIRTTRDEFVNNLNAFEVNPLSRRLWVYNMFAQDRLAIAPDLSLTAGLKLEKSSFVGWQLLPNLRLAYRPSPRALLWAAVSRAVRTPSRIDRQLELLPLLAPSTSFDSEKLVALEAGYRGEPASWLTLSVNLFYNFYTDLRTTEFLDGENIPIELLNGRRGRTYGIEAWGKAQLLPWWRVSLGVSTLHKNFHVIDDRVDLQPRNSLGADPDWQVLGSSDMDLTHKLKLTLDVRGVGPLDLAPAVPGYVEAGGQLAYQINPRLDLFVAGRNLLHRTHLENGDGSAQLARRTVYAGLRARF